MPKLRIKEGQGDILPMQQNMPIVATPVVPESNYITQEQLRQQLDTSNNSIVEKLANRLEPASALTPEVRGVVKAVDEIQGLRNALQSPASAGIETATSTLVTTVLDNALQNIAGGGQQAAPAKPLKNTLAEIAMHNLTGESSPLPQILDALTNVLGKDKVKEGYDAGMNYIEKQQTQNNLANFVLQLDENNQEHVVAYAQQMGYSEVQYAQQKLIEHKNKLYEEIEEYQRIQQGGQQVVTEPTPQNQYVEEPIYEKPIYEEPYVEEPIYEESYIEPVIEKPVIEEPVAEEQPVLKANKVVILHSKPRKLKIAKNKEQQVDNDEIELDNIDNIIDELGE